MGVGEVLMYIRKADANSPGLSINDWKAILEFNIYGDPTTSLFGRDPAYKSDVVFLLDGSGSMVSPEAGKWQAAVDASVLFYDLMKALRHPTYEDRYNSVVFRWMVPGYTDGTSVVPVGTGMKDMSVPLSISTFNPDFTPEAPYMTPMGLGLQLAAQQFESGTEESLYTDKMIILLSDGKHNQGIDPVEVVQAQDWPGAVKVYSVGLGEDDIEPETIEQIAGATYGEYRISPTPRDIEGFFCEILCDISFKLQDVTVTGNTAPVDQGKAVFVVIWDDSSAILNFDLSLPDGSTITPAAPGAYCTYHPAAPNSTHAYYVCDGIPDALLGDWQFVNINDGSGAVDLSDVLLKVILDPQTIADFEIENIDHLTSQPIVLRAKISEDGKPKTGLMEVYADLIRFPALAAGSLIAENSPPDGYPSVPPAKTDSTMRSHYLRGVMQKMKIETLSNTGGPRTYLRDDGLGCDARKDDGIYTGVFNGTSYEGSYTFKFRARGKNKADVVFDRTETLSAYVKFAPSPVTTKVEVVRTVEGPKEKMVTSTIRVTPRGASGDYLGPFQGDLINVWTSVGNFKPGYVDNKDGSYSYSLIYPEGTTPLVSASVGNMIVAEQKPIERDRPEEADRIPWFLVLLIIAGVILLVLLYRVIWRR